jgi:hypothetical protein
LPGLDEEASRAIPVVSTGVEKEEEEVLITIGFSFYVCRSTISRLPCLRRLLHLSRCLKH